MQNQTKQYDTSKDNIYDITKQESAGGESSNY